MELYNRIRYICDWCGNPIFHEEEGMVQVNNDGKTEHYHFDQECLVPLVNAPSDKEDNNDNT